MKDFLAYVAEDILQKYGINLSNVAVVFPNKRASLFLNEYLVRQAQRPLWSPAYITISELFRQQSTLQVADPIKQVCDLHKAFCRQTGSVESLDKFYGWGQLLLADFDDIDKNMADADRVFANLRDIHELDDVSYLTDEQREIIRRFFSNFSEDHNTELKERFLRLWSHFADIYHDFNDLLATQGLAYEGALYRQVATQITDQNTTLTFPYDHYLFVGFNLLQKVEQQLFTVLQQEGKAHFYWDFDHYYMERHEAGQYIGRYLKAFPNELDTQSEAIYDNFRQPKHISYISAPTENIQARYVSTWLREQSRLNAGRRTAIVLCNEALLPVVIHCLPTEVEKVNVTTGYPLSQTAVASFIQLWFDLQIQGKTPRLIRTFQRHPYAKYVEESVCGLSAQDSEGTNKPIDAEGTNKSIDTEGTNKSSQNVGQSNKAPLQLMLNFDNVTETSETPRLTVQLLPLLRQIAQCAKDDISDPLFQESLFRAYTLVNRLNELILSGDLLVDKITLQRLVGQLIQQTSIPFHGEPAEGLQIMGVLETRNLDFDHVLLLSCNEGNLPKGVNDSSFIPHSIRQAYELTTVENKVSIYAYYFHRLLQRAGDITILYNNSTEDGQRGEMSRFMLQMMVESKHSIDRHALQSGQSTIRWQPEAIVKTDRVMNILRDCFSNRNGRTLSPSAINRYMRCPVQFYYRYVAGLKEPEVPDDEQELDSSIFGTIFHDAADIIYHQLPKEIDKQLIAHLLKSKVEIERAVDEAFHHAIPHLPTSGLHLINREVIIHYLRHLLQLDYRLAPFTILGLESSVNRSMPSFTNTPIPLSIGGRIDRLDMLSDGTIRVIDYKTGSTQLDTLPDIDAIFLPENIHKHSDYYLQTFIYADIVSRQPSRFQLPPSHYPVSPALLFIQHAAADDYNPVLKLGKEPVRDIAAFSAHFNELLEQKVQEIFSPENTFTPTCDKKICQTCLYALFCKH